METNKKLLSLLYVLLLVSLTLTACSTASSAVSAFPTGKFVDAKNEYVGYYFNGDMTWSYFTYGETGAQGKYEVKGDQWIEKGTDECPFPGTYQWSFDGTKLTLKLVGEDKCDPRREATDGQTFVLTR